jgi:hypothetical protein
MHAKGHITTSAYNKIAAKAGKGRERPGKAGKGRN